MPFITRLTLRSGDGDLLNDVVNDVKIRAERKGVQLKGPHPRPPERISVPQYKRADSSDTFGAWEYTVYCRVIEIIDHNEFAREITEQSYPDRIQLSADIERYSQVGDS